ncbi:MAG: hypothetical protein ACOC3Z_03420 [Nanoarchaeota archaeon]
MKFFKYCLYCEKKFHPVGRQKICNECYQKAIRKAWRKDGIK